MKMRFTEIWNDGTPKAKLSMTKHGYASMPEMKRELRKRFAHRLIGETENGLVFQEQLFKQTVELIED